MDAHTLHILEFPKVRDILARYSATSLGRELVLNWLPLESIDAMRRSATSISEMVHALEQGHEPPFGGLSDVRLLLRRASIGSMLTAEQLLDVAATMTATGAFYRYRMRLDGRFFHLIEMLLPVEDFGAAAKAISGCIGPRGDVLDMASEELAGIRARLGEIDERIKQQIARLLRDPELRRVLQYPNATMAGDHHVLPVQAQNRHRVQGVTHRTSPTGETVFIEPTAIANLSAERTVAKAEEDREIKRVLRRLTGDVSRHAKSLTQAIDILAEYDRLTAAAKYSREYGMSAPTLNEDGRLYLNAARHPVLESIFRREPVVDNAQSRQVVPIDVRLGGDFNILVVTGPNTGGKTVALKTVGLLSVMAQCGMHIPAAQGSGLPVFDNVLCDIGDEQSLEQSLSTFSSHMIRVAAILKAATAKSLVLLDELGAGTDPTEGAALGRALLDFLDQIGCRAIVSTHIGDLKTYALGNDRAENAAVEFDHETLKPTFRLLIGQFGMSNALTIARRLKLPKRLISRAFHYLKRRRQRAPEIRRLHELRVKTEEARAAAQLAEQEANRQRTELHEKLLALERQAADDAKLKAARDNLRVDDPVHVPRFDKVGRIVRIDVKKRTALVAVGLGQWEVPLDELMPVSN